MDRIFLFPDYLNGSSPRTRGTSINSRRRRLYRRFIPAHAGNITDRSHKETHITVHPRARGEHCKIGKNVLKDSGSSPRTRGTYHMGPIYSTSPRFIPAHAGNIEKTFTFPERKSVHPRARGEHMYLLIAGALVGGSSPRTRGTSAIFVRQYIGIRFIPAHAGNMLDLKTTKTKTTVHPRARGEHEKSAVAEDGARGSSPRTRGTFDPPTGISFATRFIPAHAGNIDTTPGVSLFNAVHPRARGEH